MISKPAVTPNISFKSDLSTIRSWLSSLLLCSFWKKTRKKQTAVQQVKRQDSKVWIFWEGHKIWKNLPLEIWGYSVTSNFKWKILSNFVAFSEYPNFIKSTHYYFMPWISSILWPSQNIQTLSLRKIWVWYKESHLLPIGKYS